LPQRRGDRAAAKAAEDGSGEMVQHPEESKFKDWKEKTEKKIEEVFGKSSEQYGRFHGLKFLDFSRRGGVPKETPLREEERAQFLKGLEDARRLLSHFMDS